MLLVQLLTHAYIITSVQLAAQATVKSVYLVLPRADPNTGGLCYTAYIFVTGSFLYPTLQVVATVPGRPNGELSVVCFKR